MIHLQYEYREMILLFIECPNFMCERKQRQKIYIEMYECNDDDNDEPVRIVL